MLTYPEVNEIAKTLPTGIYLGTRIEYTLSETETNSYYDAMKFKIVISYPSIAKMASTESAEVDVRCLLYHEVSHAMLTPSQLFDILRDFDRGLSRSKIKSNMENDKSFCDAITKGQIPGVKSIRDVFTKTLGDIYGLNDEICPLINIFEDQRIETLNKNVFLKVDFPNFIKKLNGYRKGEPIQDFRQFFYHIVRYNDIEPDLVKAMYEIIYSCKNIYAESDYWDIVDYYAGKFLDFVYMCKVKWDLIQLQLKSQPQSTKNKQKSNQKQQGTPGTNDEDDAFNDEEDLDLNAMDDESGTDEKSNDKSNDVADSEGDESDSPAENYQPEHSGESEDVQSEDAGNPDDKPEDSADGQTAHGNEPSGPNEITPEELEDIMKKALEDQGITGKDAEEAMEKLADEIQTMCKKMLNKYNCTKRFTNLSEQYILRMLRKKSIEAKTLNGYSGRLNPKNVHRFGRIEDYRWFDKANPNGLNNGATKFRINFFCDNSGSFDCNKEVANSIIRSLWNLSKKHPNFEFTLITHGDAHVVRTDDNLELDCNEGTYLYPNLQQIYQSLQKRGQIVWNFVLFDGGACNKPYYRFWNHQNVIMICDTCDRDYINQYCPKAKRIFTKNYCEKLEENLLKCMDQMFR